MRFALIEARSGELATDHFQTERAMIKHLLCRLTLAEFEAVLREDAPEAQAYIKNAAPARAMEVYRATHDKIKAIKMYREVGNVGLKEAKDAVEALIEQERNAA